MVEYTNEMFEQNPPINKFCEDCGEIIEKIGYTLTCRNGCFEDDIRNYLNSNYR